MFETAEPFHDSAEESASDDDDMFGDAEPYDDFDDELEWVLVDNYWAVLEP